MGYFGIAAVVVVGFWLWARLSLGDDPERGTWGDMFGGVNALFSGLAFAGVIVTLLMQSEELELQRDELRETRVEVRAQREQMEVQNETLRRQRFENTFFQLLRLHHEIVDGLKRGSHEGRDVIAELLRVLKHEFGQYRKNERAIDEDVLDLIYGRRIVESLGHYFRNLYRIVRFVAESDIEDRRHHVGLVRAQLSRNEQAMLFYNCLSKYGRMKFKPLVEEYALLEGVNPDDLDERRDLDAYAGSAYGDTAVPE